MKNIEKLKNENELLKQELDIITAINSKIHVDMDFDKVLDEIIIALRENIEFDGCNFSLIDKDGYMRMHKIDYTRIENKSKISQEAIDFLANAKWDYKTSPLWSCVTAREKKELYYPEININDFSKAEQEGIKLLGATSWYSLPIKLKERIFGTMSFANYGGTMYLSKYEKNLIRRTVGMIARALDNFYLYKELKEKNEIIKHDMLLAKRIQQNFLPRSCPDFDELKIATSYIPMFEVGGDYYDFHVSRKSEKKGLGILITDASGHGVHAAFITSMVNMAFKSEECRKKADNPGEVLSIINDSIIDKTADNFVTAFYSYFDFGNKKTVMGCAGHVPLLLINRTNGDIEEIHPQGKLLGVMENPEFKNFSMEINNNMRFLFYTDGLVEAINSKGLAFENGLYNILKSTYKLNAQDTINKIIRGLEEHVFHENKTTFDDDVAIIIVDVK